MSCRNVRVVTRLKMWGSHSLSDQFCPYNHKQCFGTYDDTKFQDTGLGQDWRLWLFQVCTEWGYFTVRTICFVVMSLLTTLRQTAPPDQNLPRIVSRQLSLGYQSKICKQVLSNSWVSDAILTMSYRHSLLELTFLFLLYQISLLSIPWATTISQLIGWL
jgi:hypothetical protein